MFPVSDGIAIEEQSITVLEICNASVVLCLCRTADNCIEYMSLRSIYLCSYIVVMERRLSNTETCSTNRQEKKHTTTSLSSAMTTKEHLKLGYLKDNLIVSARSFVRVHALTSKTVWRSLPQRETRFYIKPKSISLCRLCMCATTSRVDMLFSTVEVTSPSLYLLVFPPQVST